MGLRGIALAAVMAVTTWQPAVAQDATVDGTIVVELNRLEPYQQGCRVYFLLENQSSTTIEEFQLDTYLFNEEGVIERWLAFSTPPLPAGRPRVSVLGLEDIPCESINRMLLNDVRVCQAEGGVELANCASVIEARNRTSASFEF